MAAVTLLGTATFNTTSGTHTVTATPVVGDLIVIVVANTGSTSSVAPTDNNSDGNGVYTLIDSVTKATSADTMRFYIRNKLINSATSTIFTQAPGTTSGGGIAVLKVTGMIKVGADAVAQSKGVSNQGAATPAPVFTSTPSSSNPIIGAVFNATNPATMTPRTGYTERTDVGYATPTTGLEVMTRDSGETSATITWGSASASAYCALVMELDTSSYTNISTLTDNFDDNSIDPTKWTTGTSGTTTIAETGGQITITFPASATASDFAELDGKKLYDLTGGQISAHVTQVASTITSADTDMRIQTDTSNLFRWVQENGTLYAQYLKLGARTTVFSVTYNATTHAWWKISESGGTVTWWTSTDGLSWTSQGTFVHGMNITAMTPILLGLCFQVETNAGTSSFDDFNLPPTLAISLNEASTVTESVTISKSTAGITLSVSDSSVVTDTVDVLRNKTRDLSVFDSSTASDRFVNSILFAGATQQLTVPASASLTLTNNFSISAWIRLTSLPSANGAILVRWGATGGHHNYYLDVDSSGQLFVGYYDGSTWQETPHTGTALSTGVWYFVAGILNNDAGVLSTYINAAQNTQVTGLSTGPASDSTQITYIGSNPSSEAFQGYITDVRVYNAAHTQSRLTSLYQTGSTSVDVSNMKMSLPMNEGTGGSVADVSGNNNNASFANSPSWSSIVPASPFVSIRQTVNVNDSSTVTESVTVQSGRMLNISLNDSSTVTDITGVLTQTPPRKITLIEFTNPTESVTVGIPPYAPSNLVATQNGTNIDLTWTDNSTNETGFALQRKRGGSSNYYTVTSNIAINATSYTDTTVGAGYDYTYRLQALGGGGSPYTTSNTVTMTGTKAWTARNMAWLYPGDPTCSTQSEYEDGRVIHTIKPQYFTVSAAGVLTQIFDPADGCNAYSISNVNDINAHSDYQFVTVAAGYTGFHIFINDSVAKTAAITTLTQFVRDNNFTGVDLDFEGYGSWTPTEYTNYKQFVEDLATSLHTYSKKLMINAPAIVNTTYQGFYPNFRYEDFESSSADFITMLLYDYEFDAGAGSSIQPVSWAQGGIKWIKDRISDVNRIVIAMPSYGYYGATGGFAITIQSSNQILAVSGSGAATRNGDYEMTWASGGVSYFYQDASGINSKREMLEDEQIPYVSVWSLGGNPWFTGKTELTRITEGINIFDSSTVTESVTVQIASNIYSLSVNDVSTVTDVVTQVLKINIISVNDSSSVTESVTLLLRDSIAVNDTSTVTDVPSLVVVDFLNVNDSSTATESVSVVIPTIPESVFDTSTVTDVPIVLVIELINVNDSTTVTENVSITIPVVVSVFDTSAVTDVVTQILITNKINVFDSSTVTENTSVVIPTIPESVFDTTTITESVTITIIEDGDIVDASTVTESVTMKILNAVTVNDASIVTESTVVVLVNNISVTDSTTVTDVVVQIATLLLIIVSDSITPTENIVMQIPMLPISVADNSTITENVSASNSSSISIDQSTPDNWIQGIRLWTP